MKSSFRGGDTSGGPKIELLNTETRAALIDMGKRYAAEITHDGKGNKHVDWNEMRVSSPGFRRNQFSYLLAEVVIGPKELIWHQYGQESRRPVNLLHIFPNRMFLTEQSIKMLAEMIDAALAAEFRMEPGHQDRCIEWVEDVSSFCVFLLGADHDPRVHDRLMRASAMVNGALERKGVLLKG